MAQFFLCHIIAVFSGYILDLILGDPRWLYHPVRAIGALIGALDKALYVPKDTNDAAGHEDKNKEGRGLDKTSQDGRKKIDARNLRRGILLALIVMGLTVLVTAGILVGAYLVHIVLGCVVESLLTWMILAIKSLKVESMRVYSALEDGDLDRARQAVSMIVGRDTNVLDEAGVIRATVETIAENTSDGVIAPLFYTVLGGPILGMLYKSINTMDSMIGYKNDRYLYLGRFAARLDDVVNFLPARLAAILMIMATGLSGDDYNPARGILIYVRDRRLVSSPNAGQCEAVCAGALEIRLLGPAVYFGKRIDKPYIGDDRRKVEAEDIKRTNKLMFVSALILEATSVAWMLGAYVCMILSM